MDIFPPPEHAARTEHFELVRLCDAAGFGLKIMHDVLTRSGKHHKAGRRSVAGPTDGLEALRDAMTSTLDIEGTAECMFAMVDTIPMANTEVTDPSSPSPKRRRLIAKANNANGFCRVPMAHYGDIPGRRFADHPHPFPRRMLQKLLPHTVVLDLQNAVFIHQLIMMLRIQNVEAFTLELSILEELKFRRDLIIDDTLRLDRASGKKVLQDNEFVIGCSRLTRAPMALHIVHPQGSPRSLPNRPRANGRNRRHTPSGGSALGI